MVSIIEVFHTMYFAGLKIDLVFHPPNANTGYTCNFTEIYYLRYNKRESECDLNLCYLYLKL